MNLVILDRDGVINEDSDAFIKTPEEWRPIPGSLEAIARLNQAGYTVVVATNQSGLARRLLDEAALQAIHERLHEALRAVGGCVADIVYCPHGPWDHCVCRKPRPGLFEQIAHRYAVPLKDVPAIGDSLRDLKAAKAAGARPILVLTGKGRRAQAKRPAGVPVFTDLAAAIDAILSPTLKMDLHRL